VIVARPSPDAGDRKGEPILKRIVLVRHATAVETGPQGSDFHRRLKKRGRREASLMAERLAALGGTPDLILTSPADRAVETARAFAERFAVPETAIELREQLYGGLLADEFLRLVQSLDDRRQCVFVFGHDPSFSEFAALLVRGFTERIPKAGCLVIDVPRKNWRALRPGDGSVVAFERPPAPDVQKRIEADLDESIAASIRTAVFAVLRGFDVPAGPDVVRVVARAASRVAKAALPAAMAAGGRRQPGRGMRRARPSVKARRRTGRP
jgi:phosphohistidine phosphatase